ncbi:MAG: GGDEF domain-containing protein [Sphingomonadaceae bacterium]|nr:GGDEF domain-containing protein [Sphingomonadaceae bacterium]
MTQFSPSLEPEARLARLARQLDRERQARAQAEAIAEKGLRDLYENQQWLALLQRVTDGANRSTRLTDAMRMALEEICAKTGWAFGNALLVSEEGTLAVGADIWFAEGEGSLLPFVEATRTIAVGPGEGMAGDVLSRGQASWHLDLANEAGCERCTLAVQSGFTAGFAIPVLIRSELVAILEFFSRTPIRVDEQMQSTLHQIGVQLGYVAERERNRAALLHEARHDALTGLGNRKHLAELAAGALTRHWQTGSRLALLAIDLDGFKAINDSLGHHAGDTVLVATARRLERCIGQVLRPLQDRGSSLPLVARVGGDEFVVLVEDAPSADFLNHFAENLHEVLAQPINVDGGQAELAAAIGIAVCIRDRPTIDQLLRDADLAMYEAKSRGRSQTVIFSSELGEATRQRRILEAELKEAIHKCQFVLHYQPIVALDDGHHVVGYEALVRWQHPSKGLLHPGEFIEIAEECGLITFLGGWILEEACRAAARLAELYPRKPLRFISVNVAAPQFLASNFADRVRKTLMRTGVTPEQIRLEITESVAIADPDRTAAVLQQVREWGVQTSLDDFGTGYSSLSYLKQLPFDTLKIDRSFVNDLQSDKSQSIVQAIMDLARSIDLKVVAEGIETAGQGDTLAKLGCGYAQGYWFGRPSPENEAFAS